MMNKYVAIVEVELKPQSIEGTGFELIDDWQANQSHYYYVWNMIKITEIPWE